MNSFPRIRPSVPRRMLPALGLVAVLAMISACTGGGTDRTEGETAMPARDLDTVIKDSAAGILALPGVEGLYGSVSEAGKPCIKVTVVRDTPEVRKSVPEVLGGYPVVIVETGPIRPMGKDAQ